MPGSITPFNIRKEFAMSEPRKPTQASTSEAGECLDACPGDEAGENIERTDIASDQAARQCDASPPLPEDEEFIGQRPEIHLSDQDRDLFLALLDSDEGPNEALRQAAEAYKRTIG
jgi:Protein of unknown function (DUF1778)